jgi:hypothetical protein
MAINGEKSPPWSGSSWAEPHPSCGRYGASRTTGGRRTLTSGGDQSKPYELLAGVEFLLRDRHMSWSGLQSPPPPVRSGPCYSPLFPLRVESIHGMIGPPCAWERSRWSFGWGTGGALPLGVCATVFRVGGEEIQGSLDPWCGIVVWRGDQPLDRLQTLLIWRWIPPSAIWIVTVDCLIDDPKCVPVRLGFGSNLSYQMEIQRHRSTRTASPNLCLQKSPRGIS